MEPLTRAVLSGSEAETFELGRKLGAVLAPGDFVGLDGQLGAGKTAFSRGVAAGLEVPLEDVSSPTYSIVQSYSGRLPLHHLDLYRLRSEGDLFAVGYFDLLESGGVMLVEWLSQIAEAKPDDSLRVVLEVESEVTRRLRVEAAGPRSSALLSRWLGP